MRWIEFEYLIFSPLKTNFSNQNLFVFVSHYIRKVRSRHWFHLLWFIELHFLQFSSTVRIIFFIFSWTCSFLCSFHWHIMSIELVATTVKYRIYCIGIGQSNVIEFKRLWNRNEKEKRTFRLLLLTTRTIGLKYIFVFFTDFISTHNITTMNIV